MHDRFSKALHEDGRVLKWPTLWSAHTYPRVSFRCQRICHPRAKPGSRRLDGDGIADACQLATRWKGKAARCRTSVAIPFTVLRRVQRCETRDLFPFTWNPKDFAWRTSEWVPGYSLYTPALLLGAWGAYYSHMFAHANAYFTPSLWTCGKKKDGGVEV